MPYYVYMSSLCLRYAPSCAQKAVKNQNANYYFHTKIVTFGTHNISNDVLHEHILFNAVSNLNVGMQSTQVDEACDDDMLEQFSSNSYISHTLGKLTDPSLLLLKRASVINVVQKTIQTKTCPTTSRLIKDTMKSQRQYYNVT